LKERATLSFATSDTTRTHTHTHARARARAKNLNSQQYCCQNLKYKQQCWLSLAVRNVLRMASSFLFLPRYSLLSLFDFVSYCLIVMSYMSVLCPQEMLLLVGCLVHWDDRVLSVHKLDCKKDAIRVELYLLYYIYYLSNNTTNKVHIYLSK